MAKVNRQFDRNKYLTNLHQLSDEQHDAVRAETRRRAATTRPSEYWLRACATLVVNVVVLVVIGWLADWSFVSTAIAICVVALALAVMNLLIWHFVRKQRQP